MPKRALFSLAGALLLSFAVAGTTFAAHCVNESKKADAGNRVVILVPLAGEPIIIGANAAGRAPSGFADVYLDLNGNGQLDMGVDVLIASDTFLVSNHSHRANPAQGSPGVLPSVHDGKDPAGEGRGVGAD